MSYVGVDLDGTLAVHAHGDTVDGIGEPIPAMVERVKAWLAVGIEVRIITARVARVYSDHEVQRAMVERWCLHHIGRRLPVQDYKCGGMGNIWDDRAVYVERNTGRTVMDIVDAWGRERGVDVQGLLAALKGQS